MKDLKKVRDRVKKVIINSGYNPILAEDNIDYINTPKKGIEEMVDRSDAYIGIFDKRWGYVPEEDNPDKLSVTAIEYYRARRKGIPMLILVSKNKKEDELEKFLDKIGDYHTGQWLHYYNDKDELITIVANAIPTMKDYYEKKIKFEASDFKVLYKDELTEEKVKEEFERWKEGFELDFASIYHKYDYRRKIVDDVKNKLEEYKRAVITGESGTSKTTIFKRVLCEYLDDHIVIYHDGINKINDVKDYLSELAKDNKVIVGVDNAHTKQSLMIYKLMEELPNVKFLLTIREPDYERLLKEDPEFRDIPEVIRAAIYRFDANKDEYIIKTTYLTKDEVKELFDYYKKPLPNLDEFYKDTKGHPLIVRFHITGNGLDKHVKDRHDLYINNDDRLKTMIICSLLDLANSPIDDKLAKELGILDDLYYLSQAMLIHKDNRWYTIHHLWAIAWFYHLFNIDDSYKLHSRKTCLKNSLKAVSNLNDKVYLLIAILTILRISIISKPYNCNSIFNIAIEIGDMFKNSDIAWLVFYYIGNYLNELGRYKEALKYHNKTINLNPKFAEAWFNKGVALRHLREYDKAIKCYDKAIAINPNYAEAWNNKGVALIFSKRYHDAVRLYVDMYINGLYNKQMHYNILLLAAIIEGADLTVIENSVKKVPVSKDVTATTYKLPYKVIHKIPFIKALELIDEDILLLYLAKRLDKKLYNEVLVNLSNLNPKFRGV